jgi:hypothetical protein
MTNGRSGNSVAGTYCTYRGSSELETIYRTVRLDLRTNFFSIRAVDGWNMILKEIKKKRQNCPDL